MDLWTREKPAGQRVHVHVDEGTPYSQASDDDAGMVWISGICAQDLRARPHGIWTILGTSAVAPMFTDKLAIRHHHF